MRGRSSSKQMETNKVTVANEEPRLSGAYIRTLVKHLSSKDSLDVSKTSDSNNNTQKPQQTPTDSQPPQHKKQVRRRLHTSKPYQERLLNMAEARREIVTALKFHRASMKQQAAAGNNNNGLQSPPQSSLGQEKRPKSRSINSLYPSTTCPTASATTSTNSYWPMSAIVPPPPPPPRLSYDDNHNFVLPTQSLGLNLNYQNFSNLNTNIYHKPMSMSIDSPSSSTTPSSYCSPVPSIPEGKPNSSGDLHHAMDDEEMEEIRSLGEQHQIEWNDTINIVTSARWCSFLNTIKNEAANGDECDGFKQFDQIMEFPQWLINANESSCLQQHFDDQFSDAYFQDPALPCMDIGEIEAMDGEWLA